MMMVMMMMMAVTTLMLTKVKVKKIIIGWAKDCKDDIKKLKIVELIMKRKWLR